MSKLSLAIVALAAVGYATVGRAEDAPAAGSEYQALFVQLDTNKDGLLGGDEIPEDKKTLFERLVRLGDGNADGKLSADEFAAGLSGGNKQPAAKQPDSSTGPNKARPGRPGKAVRPGPGQLLVRLDANGDGKIVLDEVPEPQRERFSKMLARIDRDGDGALSLEELKDGNPVKPASTQRPAEAKRDPAQVFKRLDTNGDGKLVSDEAPEARRQFVEGLIKRADKDSDGAVSLEEFTVVAERMRSQAKPEAAPANPKKKKKAQPVSAKKGKKNAQTPGMPAGLFVVLDVDGDGQLSKSEIGDASASILKLDRNGDGQVSVREVSSPGKMKKNKKKKKSE